MNLVYAIEPWSRLRDDITALINDHWEEVAVYQDQIKLDVDWDAYLVLERRGQLHCLAVRDKGKLVGYYIGIIKPHLHYQSSLTCFTDVYFIDKSYRKGRIGIELFRKMEESLKSRGVQRMITSTKRHIDMSAILERLGFEETERVFMKLVG